MAPSAQHRRWSVAIATLLILSPSGLWASSSHERASGGSPAGTELLRRAFENRYEVDVTSRIELRMFDRAGREHRRVIEAASKLIGDRMHTIGRLEWPNHLRGMGILTVEAERGGHDAFVYLPALGRNRRISTAQRSDSFFGTDVTYEDLERRHASEFAPEDPIALTFDGEEAFAISAVPLHDFSYDRARFVVAKADTAILEVSYYKTESAEPFRVVHSPRADMRTKAGHTLPTRMTVRNLRRGTRTEVSLGDMVIGAEIADTIFTASALETGRKFIDPDDERVSGPTAR